MKIGERTINNALFNAVSGMLPLALSFIFWPYIVSRLGDSSYGIYALVGAVIGYFALLDMGMSQAIVKYIAEYAGRNDTGHIKETLSVALTIFTTAGTAGLLLILVMARVLATQLLKIPPDLVDVAYTSFCAASLGFFFTMLLTLLKAIIEGLNRYDISSITMAVMGAFSTIGAVILLRMGFGLVAVVWLNVAVPLLAVIFYFFVVRHLLPGMPLRFSLSKGTFKRILHFGVYAFLNHVTDIIIRQVAPLIIGTMLGVSAVTYYIVPFTILNRLATLLVRVGMVIFPAVSELQGQNRLDTIRDLYLTASRLILSFSIAYTVPLLIFGKRFLHLWMGPEFAGKSGMVLILITVGIFIDQCTNVPTFVVNGLGRPKVSGMAAISKAALFLGLMIGGAKYGGIIGVAVAFTLSNMIVGPIFTAYVCRKVLGIKVAHLLRESYMRPLLAVITGASPLLLVPQEHINNLFLLLLVMIAGMSLYFVVALLFGVYHKRERKILTEYLTRAAIQLRNRRILRE